MNRAIYDSIASDVTVYSGQSEVNPATAPELVLRTIPNLTARQRDEIMSARAGRVPSELTRVDVITILADARTTGGGRFVREIVLRRSGEPGNPFQILDWRQTWQSAPP